MEGESLSIAPIENINEKSTPTPSPSSVHGESSTPAPFSSVTQTPISTPTIDDDIIIYNPK